MSVPPIAKLERIALRRGRARGGQQFPSTRQEFRRGRVHPPVVGTQRGSLRHDPRRRIGCPSNGTEQTA